MYMLDGQTEDILPEIRSGELCICMESRNAWIGEKFLELTKYGFDALRLLTCHPRTTVS